MDSRTQDADLYNNVQATLAEVDRGSHLILKSGAKVTIQCDIRENVTISLTDNASLTVNGLVHATTKFILKNKAVLTFVHRPPLQVVNNVECSDEAKMNVPASQSGRSLFVAGKMPVAPRSSTTGSSYRK